MSYLWYLAAVLCGVMQSATAKGYHRRGGDAAVFNIGKSAFAFALFTCMAVATGFSVPAASAGYGLAYGVSLAVSMYCGYMALCYGPMALTGLIVSFSVVMPVLYGIFFCKEGGSYFRIGGLLCFAAAMVFVNLPNRKPHRQERITDNGQENGTTDGTTSAPQAPAAKEGVSAVQETPQKRGRWLAFVAATFLCNGICAILQKAHGMRFGGAYCEEFMFFAMAVCTVGFGIQTLLVWFWRDKTGRSAAPAVPKTPVRKGVFWLAALSGICNAATNYATTRLSGTENASVLFPAVSVGTVCVSLLCGWLLFAEKPRWNHIPAFVLGLCAIVLLRM